MGNFIKCFDNNVNLPLGSEADIEPKLAESPCGTQLRFAFSQALLVSYFGWMYGIRNNPFVTKYANWLKGYIENLERQNFEGIYLTMYNYLKAIPDSWYGGRWIDLPIKEVKMLLIDTMPTEEWYPKTVIKESFIVPYLMMRNGAIQEGYASFASHINLPWFGFNLAARRISVTYHGIGDGLIACPWEAVGKRDDILKKLSNMPTIAHVLIRTELSRVDFEQVLSLFARLSLDTDPYRPRSASDDLFYASYTILRGMVHADITSQIYDDTRDCDSFVDEQLSFGGAVGKTIMEIFHILNKTQGSMFGSKDFFLKYFGRLAKTSPQVMDVVKLVSHSNAEATPATEMLAVKNGIFSGMEAIRLFSHEDESQISSAVSAETTQEPGTDEDDLDTEDIPDIEVADPGLEAEGEDQPSEEEEDTSTDSDQGEDDSSSTDSDDAQTEDPQPSEGQDDQSGEETSGDDSSGNQDSNGVQGQGEAEDIDTSDEEGIEIEFSGEGGDSVDTVLFREELDQFISDTLVNPPKKLSPQSVAALTTLQRCWVHILTVETVVRILDRIVAIPDKFKQILTNQESKKHE